MAYRVIGPRSVLGAARGELVDLSSMAHEAVRALVLAGHVAEEPQESDGAKAPSSRASRPESK